MSRDIGLCHQALQPLVPRFLQACRDDGIEVIITCTFRSLQEQADLYARGRSQHELDAYEIKAVAVPGVPRVTNARPGESRHNYMVGQTPASLAFDCVPLRHGKPVWGAGGAGINDDQRDDDVNDLELWQRVGLIGEGLGLQWAGRWVGHLREMAHFQIDAPA